MHEISLVAFGDLALFTRVETRADRVSYVVPPPSACRGLVSAVMSRPEMSWHVVKVEILRPWWVDQDIYPTTCVWKRNEIQTAHKLPSLVKTAQGLQEGVISRINPEECRTQRNSLMLKNVAYRITVRPKIRKSNNGRNNERKYVEMLLSRLKKGAFFHKPYFGCREFPCYVRLPKPEDQVMTDLNFDCGMMIHHMDYSTYPPAPVWFPAKVRNGVMDCDIDSETFDKSDTASELSVQSSDSFLRLLYQTSDAYNLFRERDVTYAEPVVIVLKKDGSYSECESSNGEMYPRRIYTGSDRSSARFLIENPTKVLCTEKKKQSQHEIFVDQIRRAAHETRDAGLLATLKFLESLNENNRNQIYEDIKETSKSQWVSFAIYGSNKNESVFNTDVRKWWKKEYDRQLKAKFDECYRGACQVSGKHDIIPDRPVFPPSPNSPALLTADKATFEYSGYSGMECSHIGLDAWVRISLAFESIYFNRLSYRGHSKNTCFSVPKTDQYILSWFCAPSEVTANDESALEASMTGFVDDEEDPWNPLDWIREQYYRKTSDKNVCRTESSDTQYGTMIVQQNKSRLSMLQMSLLTLDELRECIVRWVDDISIERKYRRLISAKQAMKLLSGKNAPTPQIVSVVHDAFFKGKGFDDGFLARFNHDFVIAILKDDNNSFFREKDLASMMKMALIRRKYSMPNKWSNEKAAQSPAYSIGGILALTAYAQHPQSRGEDSIIPSRFLQMCITSPVRANAPLLRYFTIYINRLKQERAGLSKILQRARDYLAGFASEWPESLSHVEKSELCVGFSMMRDALREHRIAEIFPNLENKNVIEKEK